MHLSVKSKAGCDKCVSLLKSLGLPLITICVLPFISQLSVSVVYWREMNWQYRVRCMCFKEVNPDDLQLVDPQTITS